MDFKDQFSKVVDDAKELFMQDAKDLLAGAKHDAPADAEEVKPEAEAGETAPAEAAEE